jgi:hypothetical protein
MRYVLALLLLAGCVRAKRDGPTLYHIVCWSSGTKATDTYLEQAFRSESGVIYGRFNGRDVSYSGSCSMEESE